MEENFQCPLDPFLMGQLKNIINLARVQEIENHISSSSCIHPPLKDIILHGTLDGTTPLILACEQGDLNSVQHIVDVWGADVRAAANYYHLDGKIGGATPIFVAVLNGHVDIVSYLISKGADVNAITSTEVNDISSTEVSDISSTEDYPSYRCFSPKYPYRSKYEGVTPLQVALDQFLEQSYNGVCVEKNIFRLLLKAGANTTTLHPDGHPTTLFPHGDPMWWFCDVYLIMELIEHCINLDLDLRDSRGNTILHHWIDLASSNLDINDQEKFFVDGVSQLLARGVDLNARDRKGFTPILKTAELKDLDVKKPTGSSLPTLLSILDLLLERGEIDPADKIDAMELAGARLLLSLESGKAFHYWQRALRLREKEGNPAINKIPLQTSGQTIEWETPEQLEGVIQDKSVHWVQAMLAGLRIYASKGLEAVYVFMNELPFMLVNGYSNRVDVREVEKVATLTQISHFCLEILGVFLRFDPYDSKLWGYKELTYELLAPYFSTLGKDKPLPNAESEKIKLFLQLICAGDPDRCLPSFRCDYEFFTILSGVPDLLLHKDIRYYLTASARQDDEGTLLYQAYRREDWKTFRLLLHLRADPNATAGWYGTRHGNTIFHLAADIREHPTMPPEEFSLAELLFDYGAQPYLKNNQGETPVDLWVNQNCGKKGMQSPVWQMAPYWCSNTVPKLSCLAAKTIHTEGIPYSRRPGDLPVELLHFLEKH